MADNRADMKEAVHLDQAAREAAEEFAVSKGGDDLDPPVPGRKGRLFAACACILGNETCERLAYYGLQTNMGLFLKNFMGYPADQASQLLQAWKGTVYLTPLLGAYLADAYMGRYLVILVFSIIYCIGLAGLTTLNFIPSMSPRYQQPPANGTFGPSRAMLWAFLYLVALGSGGIKPCVSSFGGDQFREDSKRERGWRSSFYNWFYFSINIGSLVATLVVVPIQESKGYRIGFGIPTIAMFAAVILFVIGRILKLYTIVPPEGSPFFRIYKVLQAAWRNRREPKPLEDDLYEPGAGEKHNVEFRMAHTERMPALDKAAIRRAAGDGDGEGAYLVTRTEVEETKAFLYILPVFLVVCLYQMAYDPIFTLLPYPGDVMDRSLGSSGFKMPASSISFANTFGVLLTIPLYDLVVVPLAIKMGRPITMITRIGCGFFLCMLALLSAGFIEVARYRMLAAKGFSARFEAAAKANPDVSYTDEQFTEPMSIWWQFIPYFLLGMSEVFTNVGVMELFYTQVSEGMRAIGTSMYLLTVAIGTYMATALNLIVAAAFPKDLWVSDNPIYGHYDWYFFLNAVIVAFGLVIFIFIARKFEERPIAPTGADDPFDKETRLHAELANVSRTWPSVASRGSRLVELRARSNASITRRRSTVRNPAAPPADHV